MTYETELSTNFSHSGLPIGPDLTLSYPDDVLDHPTLTKAEKAAILASWASDARAVRDAPTLRQLDNGAAVDIDLILRALMALGEPDIRASKRARPRLASSRRARPLRTTRWFGRKRGPDDDGTPPPMAPAMAARPVGGF